MSAKEPSVVTTLRVALEDCVNGRATTRKRTARYVVPTMAKHLVRMAENGGTPDLTPAQLHEIALSALRVASLVSLRDAKEFKVMLASEAFQEAWQLAHCALDDCRFASNVENDEIVIKSHQSAKTDALRTLKAVFGERLVPVMQSHKTVRHNR